MKPDLVSGDTMLSSKGSLPRTPSEDSEALEALRAKSCPVEVVGRRCWPRLSPVVLREAVRTLESKSPKILTKAVGVEPSSMAIEIKIEDKNFLSRFRTFFLFT